MSIAEHNLLERRRDHYRRNREQQLIWHKKRYQERKEEIIEYQKVWRANNPKKIKEMSARYKAKRIANYVYSEEERAKKHQYYLANKEKIANRKKEWIKNHPIERRLQNHRYRAHIQEKIEKEQIINWESRICGICNDLIMGEFHIDHILPLSRGGTHELHNLQLAHPSCNCRKNNRIDFVLPQKNHPKVVNPN